MKIELESTVGLWDYWESLFPTDEEIAAAYRSGSKEFTKSWNSWWQDFRYCHDCIPDIAFIYRFNPPMVMSDPADFGHKRGQENFQMKILMVSAFAAMKLLP